MFFPFPVRLPHDCGLLSVALDKMSRTLKSPSASLSIVSEEEGVQDFLA